jgi:2',3'-cyclic-nucleotide 2'-phosphodiesterase / 3'-nucleotidase
MRLRLMIAAVSLAALVAPALAGQVKVRLLATTDIHMNLVDYDFIRDEADETIGLNRTAALISEARLENPNTLLFDNGDLLQGAPMGDVAARVKTEWPGDLHPAYVAMNLMGYDASVAGNHEFNFGLEVLEKAAKGPNFPMLAGNVYWLKDGKPGETILPASILVEKTFKDSDGKDVIVKVGVIGVLTPQIMEWDKDKLEGKVTTGDGVEAVEREIPKLKDQGADLIVVLAHAGLSAQPRQGMDENFAAYLTGVRGVDAVITGHSHRVFPGPDYATFPGADLERGTLNGTPVNMAGSFGSHLGVIDLTLEEKDGKWVVMDARSEARPVAPRGEGEARARLPADARITEALKPWIDATLAYIRAPIGEATGPFQTYLTLLGDTAALRLVADAQSEYAQRLVKGTAYEGLPMLSAIAPFRVGGRPGPDYYTDVSAGPIAIKNAADLYIYPNMLTLVKLTGKEVREYIEKSARLFNQIDPAKTGPQPLIAPMPAYNFDVLFGATYTIDVTKPSRYGRDAAPERPEIFRVSDIMVHGKPLDENADYLIVTNNYRSNGGGDFPRMDGSSTVMIAPDPNRDVLINYIKAKGEVTPDNTPVWTFAPVPAGPDGPPEITIEIGPAGAATAAADKRLTKTGTTETGFDVYRVNLSE